MGLRFYIGASGSGKSYQLYNHIIQEAMANPHMNYLIVVPDQFTMQTQLEMVRRHQQRNYEYRRAQLWQTVPPYF